MLTWVMAEGVVPANLGYLPGMLSEADKRPAREQFDSSYIGGSHWRSDPKVTLDDDYRLHYPGDPPQDWLAITCLGDERVLIYPHSFVVILQPDDSFVLQRMD